MTSFVDYAWWQVTPAQLKAMGFSGAMRYGVSGNTKSITADELANLRAAGFDVGLVYETVANRAAQGYQAGIQDATLANGFADRLGYPLDCTLWYAVDFDADPAQVQPYFNGVAQVILRQSAPYGGFKVIEGVHYSGIGWQTAAWSGGQVSKRAGLLQNGFHATYDSNLVLVEDFGQWRAPTPQPLEEDDMAFVIATDSQPGQYLLSGGLVLALDDSVSTQAFLDAGAKTAKVSLAEFNRIAALAK